MLVILIKFLLVYSFCMSKGWFVILCKCMKIVFNFDWVKLMLFVFCVLFFNVLWWIWLMVSLYVLVCFLFIVMIFFICIFGVNCFVIVFLRCLSMKGFRMCCIFLILCLDWLFFLRFLLSLLCFSKFGNMNLINVLSLWRLFWRGVLVSRRW